MFGTDLQTERDLQIFQAQGGDSILDYYNETSTRGGRIELEALLRFPASELREIDYRISAIRFIHTHRILGNFDRRGLHSIDIYLDLKAAVLPDNLFYSMGAWIDHKINTSNEYYLIAKGVQCFRDHIKTLTAFSEELQQPDLPPFFKDLQAALEEVNHHAAYADLLTSPPKKFSFRQLSRFDNLIRKDEKDMADELMRLTYLLDAFTSLARTAENKGLAFPEFRDSPAPEISIRGLFHPLIKNPVANDIELLSGSNLCFVSGANMAGKSTFLKSAGLCIYLAHAGFPVPAAAMETAVFGGLYTTINLSDDLNKGYSHYYSEVKRVKDIVMMIKEKKRVFVIFDELFRGTNVKDAYDATLLISSGFVKLKNSLFFISTHIVEVCHELKGSGAITFKCFDSELENGKAVYSYQLKEGISSERLGLSIVRNERIMETIEEIVRSET